MGFSGSAGISREEALNLIEAYLDTENMKNHCLAAEAIMRDLAPRFEEDPEIWGLIGLLHDLDYNETRDSMESHTLITEKILRDRGVNEYITEAIKYHNAENLRLERSLPVHFALTAAETITGMITAAALVNPEKKISVLKTKSIKKRMKAKEFARSVNREHILLCEKIDIPLDDFIAISINAMSGISDQLGL